MPTIGLCMIVKDEAAIIRRCLEGVLPLIDYVLIVDTGSRDGTQDLIRRYLHEKNLPGAVIAEPWRDFAYNRTFALQALRKQAHIDYALMIDADSVLVYAPDFDALAFKHDLHCDLYDVEMRLGSIAYMRPLLTRNRLAFSYKGVLHEYLEAPAIASRAAIQGFYVHAIQDSARGRNPNKFQEDAVVLENALTQETDPFLSARYTFYLAQSYKDCGQREKALELYRKRAQLGFWNQEVFISLYYAAQLMEALAYPDAEVIQTFLGAFEACPTRAESLHGAIRLCRLRANHRQGYAYALGKQALALPYPAQGLFVENWIYEYGLLDEFSIVAYWSGHYRESLDACRKLINEQKIPKDQLDRIKKNADFAIAKLREAGQLEYSPPAPPRPQRTVLADTAAAPDAALRIAYSACPICAGTDWKVRGEYDCSAHPLYSGPLPRILKWLECLNCGHVFTDSYYSEQGLEVLFQKANAYQLPGGEIDAQRRLMAPLIERVIRALPSVQEVFTGRYAWFDIGFGNGALVMTAAEFGFQATGFDLRESACQSLRALGYRAERRDFLTLQSSAEPPHVISMLDVLEHMPFPVEALRHAHDLLHPDGVLCLSMPNRDCASWRALDRANANPYWRELEHHHNFSQASLMAVLTQCGWAAVDYAINARYQAGMEILAKKVAD